jgi:predicted nucleic acid-binding protein
MILYLESSAVLAWLLGEPAQGQVLAELGAAQAVFASRLTLLECLRVLIVAETTGRISATDGNNARQLLARAQRGWSILEITDAVCRRAGQRFPCEPIRALDAVHLASLLELHAAEPRIQPLTLDRRVRDNALQLGFSPRP